MLFSLFFWFYDLRLNCHKSLPSFKLQTDQVSNQLVNIVEHLAAKETRSSLWRR